MIKSSVKLGRVHGSSLLLKFGEEVTERIDHGGLHCLCNR